MTWGLAETDCSVAYSDRSAIHPVRNLRESASRQVAGERSQRSVLGTVLVTAST